VAHRLAVLGAVAGVLLGTTATAYAATGSPPVTTPDHTTVHAGEGTPVDVTANDKDPDGDQLQVCRLGPLPRALRYSMVQQGTLFVGATPHAHGTYSLTYYACDESYLTAGTVTVQVKPPRPTLDIVPVGDAPPGRIRLVNTFKHATFHCQWGPLDSEKVEGKTVVRPRSTVVITVDEAQLEIDCESPHAGVSAIFSGSSPIRVERVAR
jgi:Bacterial Ig domain